MAVASSGVADGELELRERSCAWYAESKDRRYRRIINDNNLPYGYKSLCMDTLGAFGTSLWSVIDRVTDPNTHPKASGGYDPWCKVAALPAAAVRRRRG